MGNRCRLRTAICHVNSRRCSDFPEVSKNAQLWCKTTSSLLEPADGEVGVIRLRDLNLRGERSTLGEEKSLLLLKVDDGKVTVVIEGNLKGMIFSLILTVLAAAVVYNLLSFLLTWRKKIEISKKMHSIGPAHWLWGHIKQVSNTTNKAQLERVMIAKTGAKSFVTWIGPFNALFTMCHPETAKLMFKSSEPKPVFRPPGGYYFLKSWLGMGLLLSFGKKWERNRRLLTPAFHFDILKPNPLVHSDLMYYLTANGRECKIITDYVHKFAEEIIAARRKSLKEDPNQVNKRHLDFLDILITAKDSDGSGLSDEDIRAEVDTFLFGGHDTTASAISWAAYYLGKYPDEQQKVYDEVCNLTNGEDNFTWENIQECRHLSLFLKEAMRLSSPVPGVARYLTKPFVFDGVEIPAGNSVHVLIHHVNNHPDVWPDYEAFRPERFLESEVRKRDPFAYVPFSAGSRNCIGQKFAQDEEKVMIARLVLRYKISLVPDFEYIPEHELMLWQLIGTCVFAVFLYKAITFLLEWRKLILICQKIPSIGPAHWFWGHVNQFSSTFEKAEKERALIKKTGAKINCTWLGPFYPLLGVCHAETAKLLFKSTEPKPVFKAPGGYFFLKDWLGMGLLLSYGKKWERNRRLLTPAFHFDILKPYVNIYNEVADKFVVFRPERFLDEEARKRDPYAYVPFSAGPRYKMSLVPDFEYIQDHEAITRAKNGIKLKIEERR
ncbi:hypothetical protein FSP39_008326 [Pinctada imbricata]|uniref:Uncharacterized protein n=1 Tax=Pinctada imbricata TaxID=66713 RepID=A0AA89BK78_PINIB|nr:hypothetical protein FSP39_008326 [Pinctada imbricata]